MEHLSSVSITSPSGALQAEFVPGANMVCRSLTLDGIQLLHLGDGLTAYAEQGKTMGIPLLYPWANRLASFGYEAGGKRVVLAADDRRIHVDGPTGLPIHGVIPGLLVWDLEPPGAAGRLSARLAWDRPELLELFPFEHEVHVEASMSERAVTIATTIRATGRDPVPVSFGYHPYVRLPDSAREAWHVKLAAFRTMVLDHQMIPTGRRVPVVRRQFALGEISLDDAYDALAVPPQFEVSTTGLALMVEFLQGYSFAQVYAPSGRDFVCFEPMTAPTNALDSGDGLRLVPPGKEYCAAFAIRVKRPSA